MGKKDKDQGGFQLSRRDFLKVAGAGAAAATVMEPLMAAPAAALTLDPADAATTTYLTTCPYCSAQCGQRVVVGNTTKKVYDIYGDVDSPTNNGGLCAKGAGSLQLVNNPRRLGVPEHTAGVDGKDFTGAAWKRVGNGNWMPMTLNAAMGEIAPRLVAARNAAASGAVGSAAAVLAAPATVDLVSYLGFSNLGIVQKADGTYFVGTGGVKVDATALGAALAALPGDTTGLAGAIDDLVWSATDPSTYSTWTFVGRSNLKSVVFAAGHVPDSIDIVRDGATYYAYVATVSFAAAGTLLRLESTDMITWTTLTDLGVAAGTFGLVNPTVIKSGNDLKIWHNRFSAAGTYDYGLYYSTYTAATTTWSAPAVVKHGGSQLAMAGYPSVSTDGVTYTLKHTGAGIFTSTTSVATPTAFPAATLVYNGAANETNPVSGDFGLMYTENDGSALGWAYSSINKYAVALSNPKSVMFFGSSHMNNECNNIYRKIIANFGTSNVEHQARI